MSTKTAPSGEKKQPGSLRSFLRDMLLTGLIGFGGGSALIPVIERKTAVQAKDGQDGGKGLVSAEDFDRNVMIASITPGALPVELASGIGRQCYGRPGMVLGACAMALPGVIISMIFYLLMGLASSSLDLGTSGFAGIALKILMAVISAFIIYQLLRYIGKVIRQAKRGDYLALCVFVITLTAVLSSGKSFGKLTGLSDSAVLKTTVFGVRLFSVPTQLILLGMLVVLLMARAVQAFRDRKDGQPIEHTTLERKSGWIAAWLGDMLCWALFTGLLLLPALLMAGEQLGAFAWRGASSALLSFGGGDAYLTIADSLFVSTGVIESARFYGTIVAVVNILPGSILCKTLSGIGFYIGLSVGGIGCALSFALAGFAISTAVSCVTFDTAAYVYDRIATSRMVAMITRWIRPVISGLLVNVMLSLLANLIR